MLVPSYNKHVILHDTFKECVELGISVYTFIESSFACMDNRSTMKYVLLKRKPSDDFNNFLVYYERCCKCYFMIVS